MALTVLVVFGLMLTAELAPKRLDVLLSNVIVVEKFPAVCVDPFAKVGCSSSLKFPQFKR